MYTTEFKQAKRSPPVNSTFIQPKLRIGSPNDKYEQEADRIADQVVQGGNQVQQNQQVGHLVQRKCTECDEEGLQMKPLSEQVTPLIQTKSNASGQVVTDSVSKGIQSAKGSGKSIESSTKTFLENQFGSDFSNVNIHTGNKAAQLNQQVNARAFTVGNDIFFNKGEYQPTSNRGKHLLAHELTHTVQQSNKKSKLQRSFSPGRCCNDSITGEDEWALVSMEDENEPTVWQRLSVGECVGSYFDGVDCEGMTCGGGFYKVPGWGTLFLPGTCRTPGNDSFFYEDNRWTPSDTDRADALSPITRGSSQGNTPPEYEYHD